MTESNEQLKIRHACQCCGYLVHETWPSGSTWQVCPICAWSDARCRPDHWNNVSLLEARQNFDDFGASEQEFLQIVRPSLQTDGRNSLHSIGVLVALRSELFRAFAHVRRCNGTSLHEAEWTDNQGGAKSSREVALADPEIDWSDVSDEKLDRNSRGNFCFMDVWGLCFYTPRYLVRYVDVLLEKQEPIDALHALLWTLVREAKAMVPLFTLDQYEVLLQTMRAITSVRKVGVHCSNIGYQGCEPLTISRFPSSTVTIPGTPAALMAT